MGAAPASDRVAADSGISSAGSASAACVFVYAPELRGLEERLGCPSARQVWPTNWRSPACIRHGGKPLRTGSKPCHSSAFALSGIQSSPLRVARPRPRGSVELVWFPVAQPIPIGELEQDASGLWGQHPKSTPPRALRMRQLTQPRIGTSILLVRYFFSSRTAARLWSKWLTSLPSA